MLLLLLSGPAQAVCFFPDTPELVGWSPQAGARVGTAQPAVLLQWVAMPSTEDPVDPGEVRLESVFGDPVPTNPKLWREGNTSNLQLTVEETLSVGSAYRILWQDREVTHFVVAAEGPAPTTSGGRINALTAEHWGGCPGRLAINMELDRDVRAAWYRTEIHTLEGIQYTTHTGPSVSVGYLGCSVDNADLTPGEEVFIRVRAVDQDGAAGPWSRLHSIQVPERYASVSSGMEWESNRSWEKLVQTLAVFVICLLAGTFMGLRSSPGPMRRLPAWMRGPTPLDGS